MKDFLANLIGICWWSSIVGLIVLTFICFSGLMDSGYHPVWGSVAAIAGLLDGAAFVSMVGRYANRPR